MRKTIFTTIILTLLAAAVVGAQPCATSSIIGQISGRIAITANPSVTSIWAIDNLINLDFKTIRTAYTSLAKTAAPLAPRTSIQFALPAAGRTQVNIFDGTGHHIRTILDKELTASNHLVYWTGNDDAGERVSPGTYFYMVTSGKSQSVGRLPLR